MNKNFIIIVLVLIIIRLGQISLFENPKELTVNEAAKYLGLNLTDDDLEKSTVSKGDYFVFTCSTKEDYVTFLGNFDFSKYQIEDYDTPNSNNQKYCVTFKNKEDK